ncbi:MAG TPA: DciA family protein [Actinomycetes bacterium]
MPADQDDVRPGDDPQGSGIDPGRALLDQLRADARQRGPGRRRTRRPAPGSAGQPAQPSGAHPDDRDPQLLGASMDRLTTERGWESGLATGGVIGRWEQVVGSDIAAHCIPETHEDGVLTVRADSTAWATQVRLLAADLVRRLNQEFGEGTVARVVVRGPGRPSWRKGPLHVSGRGPRDTYG